MAVQAAAASLTIILVPVVLAWATASFSAAPWGRAVQFGVAAWLLAHHTGIAIPGGHAGLVPLGLMALPVMSCWVAGVRLARTLDPNAADVRAGVGRASPRMPPIRALACLVATYTGIITVSSVLITTTAVRPLAAQALVGAVIISALAGTCGAAAWAQGGAIAGARLVLSLFRPPAWLARAGQAVMAALAVQLMGGLLIFLTALVLSWHQVMLLHHDLRPGLTGGLVLVLAQLTVLPNLVVWAVSVAAGPGFAVGAGSLVQARHSTAGLLPAVPVLGAVPESGSHPAWAQAMLALPIVSGLVLGAVLAGRARRAGGESGRESGHESGRESGPGLAGLLADCGWAALLSGLIWTVLGWLSGGPAGPGALAAMGPVSWRLGLAMMAEVGAGAVLAVVALGTGWYFRRPAPVGDEQAAGQALF